MYIELLTAEFEHEVTNTRRLLKAVPQKDIGYRPATHSWSMGELAQHIATIYHWYEGALTREMYDLSTDRLERGDPNDISATIELFEKNVEKARAAMKALTEESMKLPWTLQAGSRTILGPLPRGIVSRGFLFNHIYHHRGELIVYLRATGNKVPGLYGPTYEDGLKSN
jgi:uncharacterized damage-inducible protein DinB